MSSCQINENKSCDCNCFRQPTIVHQKEALKKSSLFIIQKFETSNILSQSIVNLLIALRTFVDTLFSCELESSLKNDEFRTKLRIRLITKLNLWMEPYKFFSLDSHIHWHTVHLITINRIHQNNTQKQPNKGFIMIQMQFLSTFKILPADYQ